jgi:hypothetical protein
MISLTWRSWICLLTISKYNLAKQNCGLDQSPFILVREKQQQDGAELCQAHVKLG